MRKALKRNVSNNIGDLLKFGSIIGAASLLAMPAYAQADGEAPVVEDEVNRLGTITVEARKVEENLQDVPVSVTAFAGDFFANSGYNVFGDISRLTPNFDVQVDGVQGALFANLTIRGQTALNAQLNADQAVGIVLNGAPITRGTNLFSSMFDVEQIEVLKGPQGTLFGKNTTGGTVIVRTTAPQLGEYSGFAEAEVGNFNRLNMSALMNVPLSDIVALRIGGGFRSADGWADGFTRNAADFTDLTAIPTGAEFNDDNEKFIRGSLLIEPNDKLSIRLNADYLEVDEAGTAHRVLNDGIIFGGAFAIALATTADDFYGASHPRPDNPTLIADEFNLNGTVTYDFENFTLESITSFREQNSTSNTPFAASSDIINGQDADIFAQELRLSGQNDNLTWQTGLFYSTEEGSDLDDVGNSGQITDVQNDTLAGFAQGTFAVSDRLNVTAGIRYTEEDRSIAQVAHNNEGLVPEQSATFDGVSWTLGADYELTDGVLGYASVSRGFRSGAIDDESLDELIAPGATVTVNDILVDPEFVTNYEIGLKGDFLNNTLRWNNALWYSDYEDIQVQVFDAAAIDVNNVPILVLRNAATATLWGFESELTYLPTDNLSLGATIGYTNAEYDEFMDDGEDRSDEEIGGPEWQFSAFGRYEYDVSDNIRGGAQLNYSYRGEEELLAGNDVQFFADPSQANLESYSLVNGQLDFDIESWNTNIAIYGTNLLDEEYYSSGFALFVAGVDLAQRVHGAPRQYGVRVRKTF